MNQGGIRQIADPREIYTKIARRQRQMCIRDSFYLPEYRPIIAEAFRRACQEGVSYDLTLEIVTAKGNRRWVRTIGWPVMRDGRVVKLSGAFQDVTEARLGQEALRARGARRHDSP